jgi:hypothetical protein
MLACFLDRRQLLGTPRSKSGCATSLPVSPFELVHAPIHASCLNQIEIYFPIVQRKVLAPNDFADLKTLVERLLQRGPSNGSSRGRTWLNSLPNSRIRCPEKYVSELLNWRI